jgi:hypothetical protein
MRYPVGEVTPHGWFHLTKGDKPMMWLQSHDGTTRFDLMGGLAAPYNDPTNPEAVALKALTGLIPPWKHITQKGATQDGITHIDALLDPIEVQATLECVGRDWQHAAQVSRDLIGSIDAIKQSGLHFFHQDIGHWWADVRWFQGAPPDPLRVAQARQTWALRLQADTGCWRTDEHTSMVSFTYDSFTELFADDNTGTEDLGAVPQYYTGDGGGYCTSADGLMYWVDDPADPTTTDARRVINGPWPGFDTDTDFQVITQKHAGFQEWSLPESARNIIGGRMDEAAGIWGGDGVFVEYGAGMLRLYYTDNHTEHTLAQRPLLIPPILGEEFSLVCGANNDPRLFKVLRNGIAIMAHKEIGTASKLGADHRGVGSGMHAAGALITQATPAPISRLAAGDNATETQTGWLEMVNVGDKPMYWDATLFGPFDKVRLYDGPGADECVEFGPLLANQVVFLRTDPRSNTTLVQDLTSTPPNPQTLSVFQQGVKALLSFFSNQNAFTDQVSSLFGIATPQGNLYKYLSGRFSDNAAIPPRPTTGPVPTYHVKVEIVGGNADSKVIASGIPRRRYPL